MREIKKKRKERKKGVPEKLLRGKKRTRSGLPFTQDEALPFWSAKQIRIREYLSVCHTLPSPAHLLAFSNRGLRQKQRELSVRVPEGFCLS